MFHCFGFFDMAVMGDGLSYLDLRGRCDVLQAYCFGILAFSITARHLSMSDLSRAAMSSGAPALASMPSASSRFLISALARVSCNAVLSVLTISPGVRAGAN